jgi:hypothetical protein
MRSPKIAGKTKEEKEERRRREALPVEGTWD